MDNVFDNTMVVVPARLGSSRLNRKPLLDLCGAPMIVRVCENLEPIVKMGASVVVATDSQEIIDECSKFCINAKMTSTNHNCGTSRCWQVACESDAKFVLNVQGDEPFLDTDPIVQLVKEFKESKSEFDIGTIAIKSNNRDEYVDPSKVKVCVDDRGKALYFSRSPIPYYRDDPSKKDPFFLLHQGVYLYKREALQRFCELEESYLERSERLEQLRALQNSMSIYVLQSSAKASFGIDTQQDLDLARSLYQKQHSK